MYGGGSRSGMGAACCNIVEPLVGVLRCIRVYSFFFHGTVMLILSVFFSTEEFVYSLFFDA